MKIKRFIRRIKHSRRKTSVFSLVLIILIFGLTLGYAYVHTTLEVDGTVNVSSANWNVYWDNIVVDDISNAEVTSSPTISSGKTEVTFGVTLNNPGDRYVFTVDAVNDGTIDAMISNVVGGVYETDGVTSKPLPEYLEYEFTYRDGIEIDENHLLASGTTETYQVSVHYKEGFDTSELPTEDEDYVFIFGMNYVQKSSNAIVRTKGFQYTTSDIYVDIFDELPSEVITYDNYQDAIVDDDHDIFLRYQVLNNYVNGSSVGFLYNGNVYYLRGAGATYNDETNKYNNDSIYFESNKALLQRIFGSSNCEDINSIYYTCYEGNICASIGMNGSVSVSKNLYHCVIDINAGSSCLEGFS